MFFRKKNKNKNEEKRDEVDQENKQDRERSITPVSDKNQKIKSPKLTAQQEMMNKRIENRSLRTNMSAFVKKEELN